MSYLFLDTETTGLPSPKLVAGHPNQARICSLSAIVTNDKFEDMIILDTLIKPSGWFLTEKLISIHGITTKMCESNGKELKEVMPEFSRMLMDSSNVVCHNLKFDFNMINIEICNHIGKSRQMAPNIIPKNSFCTMELCTNILKLPFKNPKRTFGQKYKWPKLEECYEYFFKEKYENGHRSLNDVKATIRIFKHLVDNNLITIPNRELVAQN